MLLSFQASATGGLGSVKAEVMADTAVALASANVQIVSRKVIGRLDSVSYTPLEIDRSLCDMQGWLCNVILTEIRI